MNALTMHALGDKNVTDLVSLSFIAKRRRKSPDNRGNEAKPRKQRIQDERAQSEEFLGALLMIFDPFVFRLSNETVFLFIRTEPRIEEQEEEVEWEKCVWRASFQFRG